MIPKKPLSITSKLPTVGTTIFTTMSKLAVEHHAINLSQGFPNFSPNEELLALVNHYMKQGFNQYAPMTGVQGLRDAIAEKNRRLYDISFDSNEEITITSGATEALFAAIAAVVKLGDEVIVFEPAYDSYVPAIQLQGGVPVYVTLSPPDYGIDWEEVKRKISSRTRLIIINTPHNPAGSVLSCEDLNQLAHIVKDTHILILSDEVYEHIIFGGSKHNSVFTHPQLRPRSFVCGSFGKTFHVTGWKVGYCIAPQNLTVEFRKIHQYLTFSTSTPMQYALTDFLNQENQYTSVPAFYERKRNLFLESIKNSRFTFVPSQGSYFQNVCYSAISDEHDLDLAIRLTKEIGVASIPVSSFYHKKNDYKILRFCFAKDDETLLKAGEKLSSL